MRKLYVILIIACTVFFATACNGASSVAVTIAGSTSVQPYIEILVEDYAHIHPEQIIDVQGGGSSAGIQAVESGTAELGMSSRALYESEAHLWSIEIAADGLAIIVNPQNPVTNLTKSQLCGIYAGEYTNWSELGGADVKIHVITREEGSGTRSAFEDMVMGELRITPKAIVQASNGAVRQLVSDDPYSIGYISLGLVDNGEKPVSAVSIDGIKATHDNISSGEYSLFRSFLLVAAKEPVGNTMQFIKYIQSSNGQSVLLEEGLIPGNGSGD